MLNTAFTNYIKRQGFTIVELLIVIVVIAILAAITIASYNGVTKQARAAAAMSAAQSASQQVVAYSLDKNGTYPATLADADVTNSDSTTYQYSVNNTSSPHTYCITASVSDVSYFVSSTQLNPQAGGCPGHGQNGVASVTNLLQNPSFETQLSTVEVRRNLYPNPVNGGTQSAGLSQGHAPYISGAGTTPASYSVAAGWQQVTATNLPANVNARAGYYMAVPLGQTVPAGTTIGVATTIKEGTLPAGVQGRFYVDTYENATSTFRGNYNTTFRPSSSTTTRLTGTITVTGNTDIVKWYMWLEPTNSAAGWTGTATIAVAWSMVELGRPVGYPSFYGGGLSNPDPDLTPSWTGMANASPSVVKGVTVAGVNGNNAVAIRSTRWAKNGQYSLRIIPTNSSSDSFAYFSIPPEARSGGTFIATRWQDGSTATSTSPRARGISVFGSTGQEYRSSVGPNQAGEDNIRVTYPSLGGYYQARFYSGGTVGGGEVWYDAAGLFAGNYSGSYHDGDSESWIWNGAPHISTSTGPGN